MNLKLMQKFKKAFYYFSQEPDFFYQEVKSRFIYSNLRKIIPYKSFFLRRITIMINPECNFKCKMCNAPHNNEYLNNKYIKNWKENSLSINQWKKLINSVIKYKPEIVLTGGEPLLQNKWLPIAKIAKEKNLRVSLQTNGYLVKKNLNNILNYLDTLNISVDGTENIHDKIRQQANSFKTIIENLKQIKAAKKTSKLKKPAVNLCFTIMNENYYDLHNFINYLIKENLNINNVAFQHLLFLKKNTLKNYQQQLKRITNCQSLVIKNRDFDIWTASTFQPENLKVKILATEIQKIKSLKNLPFAISFVPELSAEELFLWYKKGTLPPRLKKTCLSPWIEADICPDGDVRVCPDFSLGKITNKNFFKIWNGNKAKNLRQLILNKAPFTVCKSCCYQVSYL